jgi:hypothetical protein
MFTMFTPALALICFVLDYLIIAIIYYWKPCTLKKLWNIRFFIIALVNTIIAHFSFYIILIIIFSISWTEGLTPDGRIKRIIPLAKYYFIDWGTHMPSYNYLMFSLTYLIAGSILLYLPNKFILGITSKRKCILITILLTLIPVLIINFYACYYWYWR